MDHPNDGDEKDNNIIDNVVVRAQLDAESNHQVEPNVFLVSLSGDDTGHHQQHRFSGRSQHEDFGYDSASTNDDALISNYPTSQPRTSNHPSRNNYDNVYETASSSDSNPNRMMTPHHNLLSSYSAPTDEEEAYHNRYYGTSRNQAPQSVTASDVGTTPTNPILLHTIDSMDIETNDDFTSDENPNRTATATTAGTTIDHDVLPIPGAPKMSFPTPSTDDWNENNNNTGGGRLWRLAGEVAAGRISLLSLDPNGGSYQGGGPVRQIKESFMERMRSRADPDAITTIYSTSSPTAMNRNGGGNVCSNTHGRMLKMPVALSSSSLSIIQQQQSTASADTDDALYREDEAFLINTGLAQKRVRVVQLMIIGLFGILLPWMGNVFVSSNCYFASIHVVVGSYGNVYPLHFGLWNYSPISSALNGYKYCYPYYRQSNSNDEEYSMNQYRSDPPVTSRICNSLALLAGTYSLVILWWYLISGRVRRHLWKGAVYAAFIAGMLQLATPISFFFGRTCRNNHCSVGPGTVLSAITAIAWMVFGAELHYHCPIIHNLNDSSTHQNTDLDSKTLRHDSTSTWLTKTGNYFSWHDVRSHRQHSNVNAMSSSDHQAPVVDVSQLEMSDFTSASQQYFNRFYPYRSTGTQYNPPNIS
jgi:hypothetical protein